MKQQLLTLWLLFICMLAIPVLAQEVRVDGLFTGQAVLNIDGKRRLLKQGETSPEGVRLVRASTTKAVIDVNGQRSTLGLSTTINSSFRKVDRKQVAIPKNRQNAYYVGGAINGKSIKMLVDTGATHIAMNSSHARQLGINYEKLGKKGGLSTASGIVEVWYLDLQVVDVAGITVRNVLASISEGSFPSQVLLGMSFLNHVRMEEKAGALYLTEKH